MHNWYEWVILSIAAFGGGFLGAWLVNKVSEILERKRWDHIRRRGM